jgi:hypothetical protein
VAATDPQPWADWVVALQAAGGRLALEAPSISHCMAEASRSPLYQHLLARAPQACRWARPWPGWCPWPCKAMP